MFRNPKLSLYQVNSSGGKIYVDKKVRKWLDSFDNQGGEKRSENEWKVYRQITKEGFPEDKSVAEPTEMPKISVVLVLYNSVNWIENLNKMFLQLAPWLHEIIVVDNGSADGCLLKINQIQEKVKLLPLEHSVSFAAAVNQGVRTASGDLFLLINPDIWIPKSSLWGLIHFYHDHKDAAAIAPKLMLMQTPGFINSIGNHVPLFRWGYDQGLGHLDLGQFDHIQEIEAACFATVLIPREKWESVGELDEGYPMYYEDSDWCYRARVFGFSIFLAPAVKIYHDFGQNSAGERIGPKKLENVTYSRLRYIRKLFTGWNYLAFFLSYLIFDLGLIIYSFLSGRGKVNNKAIISGWKKYIKSDIKKRNKDNFTHDTLTNFVKTYPQIMFGIPKLSRFPLNKNSDHA